MLNDVKGSETDNIDLRCVPTFTLYSESPRASRLSVQRSTHLPLSTGCLGGSQMCKTKAKPLAVLASPSWNHGDESLCEPRGSGTMLLVLESSS
eukprot:4232690-Amphidinium_carterae.1